jgi:hypothetical protein
VGSAFSDALVLKWYNRSLFRYAFLEQLSDKLTFADKLTGPVNQANAALHLPLCLTSMVRWCAECSGITLRQLRQWAQLLLIEPAQLIMSFIVVANKETQTCAFWVSPTFYCQAPVEYNDLGQCCGAYTTSIDASTILPATIKMVRTQNSRYPLFSALSVGRALLRSCSHSRRSPFGLA